MSIERVSAPFAVVAAIVVCFTSSGKAVAQSCIDDVTGRSNNCTANDVSLTSLIVSNVTDGCVSSSDTATVDIAGTLLAGTNRFDIGIFIAQDGGDAFTGSCSHDFLPPPLVAPPGHDPSSGTGPFAQLEGSSADACGDIVAGENTLRDLGGIVVGCADTDLDGFVDVGNCVSWDNQAKNNCSGVSQAIPGTKSKCNCTRINTDLGIPDITLSKSCVPDTARPGETISCTISYENVGTGPGDFLSFVDDYSETQGTVSNLVGPPGDGVVDDGARITWTPGGAPAAQANIPPGATGTLTYDFTLSGSLTNGETVTNTVTAHWKNVAQPALSVTEVTNVTTTAALVSSFDVFRHPEGRLVAWETASESRTAGFFVERRDSHGEVFVRLNRKAVPAALQPQGGSYRFVDGSPHRSRESVYRLVEVELDGRELVVDTYRRTMRPASRDSALAAGRHSRAARAPSSRDRARLAERASKRRHEDSRGRAGAVSATSRLKLHLRDSGVHHVTASDLASAFAMSTREASEDIRRGRVRLTRRGREVAWLASDDDASLSFYAPAFQRTFSLDDVVWLERAFGSKLRRPRNGPRSGAAPGRTFRESLWFEEDRIAAVAIGGLDPLGDFWFWASLRGAPGAESTFELWVPDPDASSESATLTVDLRGFQVDAEHAYTIVWNGVELGEARFEGDVAHAASLDLPAAVLRHGNNLLAMRAAQSGSPFLGAFLDGVTIEYSRRYRAVGDYLEFTAGDHGSATIAGFSSPDVRVWNVSDALRPELVPVAVGAGEAGWQATIDTGQGARYAALSASAGRSPHRKELVERSDLRAAVGGVDYVIIAPREMEVAARSFARYRAGTGYRPLVATVEDVMNEFSHGVDDPRGVREFLRFFHERMGGAPGYVLLAGNGTFDYRDLQGAGTNLVPLLLSTTASGLVASDAILADVAGDDGVPDLSVGRVPAVTNEELATYFEKVRLVESASGDASWRRRLLFVADDGDRAGNFPGDSRTLSWTPPDGYEPSLIHLGETHGVDAAREDIRTSWNDGALIVNYLGHGSMTHWANENLFDDASASLLENEERLPLVLGLTCHMGRFDLPQFQPLASELLLSPLGGASAVISSSGASVNARASRIGQSLLRKILRENRTLGQAVLDAYHELRNDRETVELLRTYNLLGDPALRLSP